MGRGMTYTFREAKRQNVPLLISVAGGTGSGKTLSGLKIARGLAGGQPFAGLDTENGRMLHYADEFPELRHCALEPPFRPERYADAIDAADAEGFPVIFVDSGSHAYAGEGGLLDWHEEELSRMAGDDWKRREAMTFAAWVKPKMAQKQFVSRLLQMRAHVIVALRAESKIEIVKQGGKTVVQPKKSLVGADGWVPVCERNFAYEMTLSVLLTADAPGTPKPIKVSEQFKSFVPLDQPLSEETGRQLAEWARGTQTSAGPQPTPQSPPPAAGDGGNDGAAPDQTPSGPGAAASVGALTYPELKDRLAEEGIEPWLVSEVGAEMFPGRTAAKLADGERGVLLVALLERKAEEVPA